MAPSWPAAPMITVSATFPHKYRSWPTRRLPLEGATPSCSGATAPPWPAARTIMASASFQHWSRTFAYAAHLLPVLLLQAYFDGGAMRFVTLGGAERCIIGAGPASRLADVRGQLMAGQLPGRLGPLVQQVDAILPGCRLLSSAPAEETVAGAFDLGRALQKL
ncbi:unnamed protein product [Prorocentrum cordatum]|uniref:Uncharacterized protein n=1 Tax=Prorocentrum cordatum TaxID=2364126 RepID=A0ABN9VDC7_9DINO|nr:unnamed protein product [Polarella glacialis]